MQSPVCIPSTPVQLWEFCPPLHLAWILEAWGQLCVGHRSGGGVNRTESAGSFGRRPQREEWQLCLSAAVGLREHWQEHSRSSSHPLPYWFLRSLISSISPLLFLFAPSNRLLTVSLPPLLKTSLHCFLLFSNISHNSLPNHIPKWWRTLTVTDVLCCGQWAGAPPPETHTHSQTYTQHSGLKWPRRNCVSVCLYVCHPK